MAEEWADLVEAYPEVRHEQAPERIEVTLELESNRYNCTSTPAVVLVPPGYRTTPPDGFLVPAGVQLVDGGSLPYGDAAGVGMAGWWLVSFHLIDMNGNSTWRPTADPRRGDNLVGYLASVEAFLAGGCN